MRVMELQDWTPDAIRLVDRPRPDPGPDEVLLRMKAASLNYRDSVVARRGYGRLTGNLPLVPVSDGAGVVVATGGGVERTQLGDLVTPVFARLWQDGPYEDRIWPGLLGGSLDGVMQEFMVVPESGLVRAPSHFDAIQAATLPCAALTAWNAVVDDGKTRDTDTVVIQGTGGVSLFALQFAKLRGARTIVLSSSDEKLERARALGADHLVNYVAEPEWSRSVREITNNRGADLIVEVGGAGTLEQSVKSVRAGGTISLIGVLSGLMPNISLGPIVTRNIRLQGITVGSLKMHADMVAAIEQSGIVPVVDERRFEFETVGSAIAAFPSGGHFGKVCCAFD